MLYVAIAATLARVPVRVHTQHNTFLDSCSRMERWKFACASLFFTYLIAVSEQTRAGMLKSGSPPGRTAVIVNGVDENRFRKREVSPASRILRIGCVARLAPEKGVSHLIRAFARIRAARPDTRLVLAGDGPEKAALEELSAQLGVRGSVDFLGYTAAIDRLLTTIDILALPSLTEGVPLAVLEAMAAGVPVVATRVGGLPEILENGAHGVLVPPRDCEALASAIVTLIDDPLRRQSLGARAREAVERRYSLAAMAATYRSLYLSGEEGGGWKEALKSQLRRLPQRIMLWRSSRTDAIALTFDDGPDEYTPRILDVLKKHNARATFFLVGRRAAADEETVRRILDEGHEIGNHSYSHPDFETLSVQQAAREIDRTQSVLERIQERPCRLFRPPKGKLCVSALLAAWWRRLTVVLWSVDLKDFRAQRPEDILTTFRRTPVRPGDVILYHGNNKAAFDALSPLLAEITERSNARLVPVSELQC
jgi:peptidoglycan/xylan/chitin deacetylase (PgdA/CDA1 family)